MSVPQAQLVLPTLDGVSFPEARIRFRGGIETDATLLEEVLHVVPKIGSSGESLVRWVVASKNFTEGQRDEDGLQVAQRVLTIGLKVVTIEPAI